MTTPTVRRNSRGYVIWTPDLDAWLTANYDRGPTALGRELGLTRKAVHGHARRLGLRSAYRGFVTPGRGERDDRPLADRFWASVWTDDAGCWPWLGGTDKKGYGRVKGGGRWHQAARVAWQLHHGKPL